jgi:hypothetical protein
MLKSTKIAVGIAAGGLLVAGAVSVISIALVGRGDTAPPLSDRAPAPVTQSAIEHHTVRLSATGISIDVGQGGVSHRAPGIRYSTSIDVSGPVAAAELSIGAFGPDASC